MGHNAESTELPAGTQLLDRYTIIDRVAGGGMATIYRATDERLDRIVCVKLLRLVVERTGSTSGGAVYQATYSHFHKEALALSKLSHPNTLRIYDFGYLRSPSDNRRDSRSDDQNDGRPFQISEFLDGGNLEQYVRTRGALAESEALTILERMASATSEAHEHQIIHRDIKPSNILFSSVGGVLMPKLADFGIARCDLRKRPRPGEADDSTTEVRSTIPLFSPRWAAPEQLAAAEEGPATDVYALGLVATFMLAGEALFEVLDVRATFAERVRGDEYTETRLTKLGFSKEVRGVLLEALRASPRARIKSPLSFYAELSRALHGGPGGHRDDLPTSIPPPPPERPPASTKAPSKSKMRPRAESSITIEAADAVETSTASPLPSERWLETGGRRVRLVDVHEKLDLAVPMGAATVRFRVTLLPARGRGFRVHVKGLNCFVAKPGKSPSPAVVADGDGAVAFVSMSRQRLGEVTWSIGRDSQGGRAFSVGSWEVVVPPSEARDALAIDVGEPCEVIVICRRG